MKTKYADDETVLADTIYSANLVIVEFDASMGSNNTMYNFNKHIVFFTIQIFFHYHILPHVIS